jgi:hypothetical protein
LVLGRTSNEVVARVRPLVVASRTVVIPGLASLGTVRRTERFPSGPTVASPPKRDPPRKTLTGQAPNLLVICAVICTWAPVVALLGATSKLRTSVAADTQPVRVPVPPLVPPLLPLVPLSGPREAVSTCRMAVPATLRVLRSTLPVTLWSPDLVAVQLVWVQEPSGRIEKTVLVVASPRLLS